MSVEAGDACSRVNRQEWTHASESDPRLHGLDEERVVPPGARSLVHLLGHIESGDGQVDLHQDGRAEGDRTAREREGGKGELQSRFSCPTRTPSTEIARVNGDEMRRYRTDHSKLLSSELRTSTASSSSPARTNAVAAAALAMAV